MYKIDARSEEEKLLSKNIFEMYMSSKDLNEYNHKVKEISNKEHKILSFLKSMIEVYVDRYATNDEVAEYYRKRQTMVVRIPKYVKFCEELFKVDPDKRIDYVDSTGETYSKVMEYLNSYKNCYREYSYLVDEFYDRYSLLMEERRQKEADEKYKKDFSDACKFFDEEIINKGYYSIPNYLDLFDDSMRRTKSSSVSTKKKKIVNRDPNVWKSYLRKMEVNRTNSYLMLKDRIDTFMYKMVYGQLNNEPVDVIDYYMIVGIPFKKFKEICDGHLTDSSLSLFNIFIGPYINIDEKYFNSDSYSKISYINCETGESVSDEEKLCVVEFLRNNNIPEVYFPIALNKYMKGNLDIKFKSLKKEF